MPYEHDESADSQASEEPSQRRIGRIAQGDIERGVVDTDKGPVLEETNRKLPPAPTDSRDKLNR